MESLLNNSGNIQQSIDGMVKGSNGRLRRIKGQKIVVCSDFESHKGKKVVIISGGGAGHGFLHGGYVGPGMLTSAVSGEIFASPSVQEILLAILLTTKEPGCLLIVKNYTGDRLNFTLAAEQARSMGLKVTTLLVTDDIANENPQKRRGIAGVVIIHKLAGYLSDRGYSLEKIKHKCEQANAGLITLGLSISGADSLSESGNIKFEPQLGRGIHNEAGEPFNFNSKDMAKEAVEMVTTRLAPMIDNDRQYAILINNSGGLTDLEMSIITDEVLSSPIKDCIELVIGPASFCTALNMRGFSLSLLPLTNEIREALLSPVPIPAWRQPVTPVVPEQIDVSHINLHHQYPPSENRAYRQIIRQIADVLVTSEIKLNDLDSRSGDADCGSTLRLAATSIQEALDDLPLAELDHLLLATGEILSRNVGGSSGVLFSILFTNAGIALQSHEADSLPKALMAGIQVLMTAAGSTVGDRTFLDALVPGVQTLERTRNLHLTAVAARTGADATANMIAKVGRAANVPPEVYRGSNDAGAEAIALIFEQLPKET
jgi:triose/dihydroxyacetone kinase / FAD-AMP lyase (cyclizing)